MNTSMNLFSSGEALQFEARSANTSGSVWLELTIRTAKGYFELSIFNKENEVGLAAMAQAINQVNAAHFAPKAEAVDEDQTQF